MRSRCRSCGAAVAWMRTTAGRWMPLDAEPTPDGVVYASAAVAHVLGIGEQPPPDAPRYTSHFATCPHASEHRKDRT